MLGGGGGGIHVLREALVVVAVVMCFIMASEVSTDQKQL